MSSDGVMIDMVKPILLPFRGLELQGKDNSVLYAVGNNINDKRDQKLTNKIIKYNDDILNLFVVNHLQKLCIFFYSNENSTQNLQNHSFSSPLY